MSARVLVVEHEAGCPPAHFATWLRGAGAELDICRPWAGDEVPAMAAYAGIVVLGGSMGADDDDRYWWLGPVKQLIRDAIDHGTPTLGICLGHQLMGAATGGVAERSPLGQQVGLYDVGWLPSAAGDPLVGDLGPVRGIQWNHDLVTKLPDGAVPLAQTPQGELQVARFGPMAWGVQLHPEADGLVIAAWVDDDREEHDARGIDTDSLVAEIAAARAELDDAWRPLAERLVELAREART
ncbi:MAG: type 1 glutamine amidotransferase [Nocardioides sp.]